MVSCLPQNHEFTDQTCHGQDAHCFLLAYHGLQGRKIERMSYTAPPGFHVQPGRSNPKRAWPVTRGRGGGCGGWVTSVGLEAFHHEVLQGRPGIGGVPLLGGVVQRCQHPSRLDETCRSRDCHRLRCFAQKRSKGVADVSGGGHFEIHHASLEADRVSPPRQSQPLATARFADTPTISTAVRITRDFYD